MSLNFKQLEKKIKSGDIDTVLVALSDMQGRLVGKRVTGKAFLDYVHKETHFCNYLYTVDMDMFTVPGFKSSSWETGYGDMTVIPDHQTIKELPWLEKTALVLGDAFEHDGKTPVAHELPQASLLYFAIKLAARLCLNAISFAAFLIKIWLSAIFKASVNTTLISCWPGAASPLVHST